MFSLSLHSDAYPQRRDWRDLPWLERLGEGLRVRAELECEARYLGEAARDERCARVAAEAKAIGDASCNRDDVLQRAAQLDAHHIVGRVGAEAIGRECILPARGDLRIAAGARCASGRRPGA